MTETKKYLIEQVCKMTMKCLDQATAVAPISYPTANVNISAANDSSDKATVKEVTEAVAEMMTSSYAGINVECIEADADFRENKAFQGVPFGGGKPGETVSVLSGKPGIIPNEKPAGKTVPEFVRELYTTLFELPDTDENGEEHVGRSPKVSVIDV